MSNDVFLFREAPDFAACTFENAVYEDGALQLAQYAGCYIQSGSCTTPELSAPAFRRLIASWNAAAPADTAVELFARVCAGESRSEWISFGRWSLFSRRACAPAQETADGIAAADGNLLQVKAPAGADRFQLRVCLYTDDIHKTPLVHLLGAAVDAVSAPRETGDALSHRCVPVPSYSQLNRNPAICNEICSSVSIAMMMNRWGEDVLPEEIAHAQYDFGRDTYDNTGFITAIAGSCGYECYSVFADAAALKKEIKAGFACGVRICCDDTAERAALSGRPLLDGVPAPADRRLIIVRGFETDEDGTKYVLVNDPRAETDADAQRRYRLDQFCEAWNGEAVFLHSKNGSHVIAPPVRVTGELRRAEIEGEFALYVHGERRSIPVDFCEKDGRCTGTVCYTLKDEHAYATAAHKRFYYTGVSRAGNILLDTDSMPAGSRITAYLIHDLGTMIVAELTV